MNRVGIMNSIDRDWGEWACMTLFCAEEANRLTTRWKFQSSLSVFISGMCSRYSTNWILDSVLMFRLWFGPKFQQSDYKNELSSHNQSTSQAFLSFKLISSIPAAFFFLLLLFWFFFLVTNWKLMQPRVLHRFKCCPAAIFSVPVSFKSFVGLPFISMTPAFVFQ